MKGHYDRKREIDWSNLDNLYTEKKLTSTEIAGIKGCAKSTVIKEMRNQKIEGRKGKDRFSEESLKKLSDEKKGNKNPFYGKSHSDVSKKKWSKLRIGENHPNYGKKLDNAHKEKIRTSMILNGSSRLSNNANWKGGISFEPYTEDFNNSFKESIRERDSRMCMVCNSIEDSRKLDVHHIDYIKENSFKENCVSLCRSCHVLTNNNREQWKTYFQSLLKDLYGYLYSDGDIVINLNNRRINI